LFHRLKQKKGLLLQISQAVFITNSYFFDFIEGYYAGIIYNGGLSIDTYKVKKNLAGYYNIEILKRHEALGRNDRR